MRRKPKKRSSRPVGEDLTFTIDYSAVEPKFKRLELLTHPHIPAELAGINPRTIKGQDWWDKQRKVAYAENNYHCWACGGAPADDPFKQHLEAHEAYRFNWAERSITLQEITALCHCCHNFIHSGRLWCLLRSGSRKRKEVQYIIETRMKMLQEAGLKPYYFTAMLPDMLTGMLQTRAYVRAMARGYRPPAPTSRRSRWHLVLDGEEYYGKAG